MNFFEGQNTDLLSLLLAHLLTLLPPVNTLVVVAWFEETLQAESLKIVTEQKFLP